MSIPRPHFLLFSDATRPHRDRRAPHAGAWRFVLETIDGESKLEAEEAEEETSGDRLDLLAVIRGLEALDQPSRVTLVTSSRYVARGLRYGLREWRENGWQWERFGQMTPIRNGDLWRRVDQALQYHQVECRTMSGRHTQRWEVEPLSSPSAPHSGPSRGAAPASRGGSWVQRGLGRCARLLQSACSGLTGTASSTPSHAGC